jgi:hypothetical protein
MIGWVDGLTDVKAVLSLAYSNQNVLVEFGLRPEEENGGEIEHQPIRKSNKEGVGLPCVPESI